MGLQRVLCLAMMVAALLAPSHETCAAHKDWCNSNDGCCTGCCLENKCVAYSPWCATGRPPCAVNDCPPHKVCYHMEVECPQPPCEVISACKLPDKDFN